MDLEFNELFVVYLSVFLAVILAAWLISLWRGHAFMRRVGESIQCPFCEHTFNAGENRKFVRCTKCHGRFRKLLSTSSESSPYNKEEKS
jgi:protein-arginine kinase activator protein McsA